MIDPQAIRQELEQLSALLHNRLSIRGATFEAQLKRAGRLLPKRVHLAGRVLIDAQYIAQNPKLARLGNARALSAAGKTIRDFLEPIDPVERRRTKQLRIVAGILLNLVVLATLVITLLRWRDLI